MIESIRETARKIKAYSGDWVGDTVVALAIILVGIGAFGLGRISAQNRALVAPDKPGITTVQSVSAAAAVAPPVAPGGMVMASKSGSKYYFPWCGTNIAEKNKIWFKDEAAAKVAGYSPAKNCKGLE